jgi:C4-dicarboxylate-specific signal transduction histidine kinase
VSPRRQHSTTSGRSERVQAKERLEAELERTRGLLLQVERLASLGTLAAGVGEGSAFTFRLPLAA